MERSYVFSDIVTSYFERYNKNDFLSRFSNKKEKNEVCIFCQRAIGRNETHRVIKENVVYEDCYKKIEIEKKKK